MKLQSKITFLIAVIAMTAAPVLSQKETLAFKISKPKSEVKLYTADSVFHIKKSNPLRVHMTGKNTVFRVTALNGTVKRRPNNFFEIKFSGAGETVIKVYEKTPDGTTNLALSQAFKVVAPPQPTVYVCGVKSDSAIDKKHLIKVSELSAGLKESRIIPAVMSFDVIMPQQAGSDTIHVKGAKFPVGLKNKLYEIDEGQVLIFQNIKVLMPGYEVTTVQEVLVFITKTDQYSVGHRNETMKKVE